MYRTYIAKKRSELGISREKLCEGICNISTLYRFENNKCDISVEIFMKLCKKLKLPYIDIELFFLSEEEYDFYKFAQEYIYYSDIDGLTYLLSTTKVKKSKEFFKIYQWVSAVRDDLLNDRVKALQKLYKLNPSYQIKEYIDFSVLNSIAMIYIKEKKYDLALKCLENCNKSIDITLKKDLKLYIKIKYNLAYILYNKEKYIESANILDNLIYQLKINNSNYMLGKIYFFLSLCCKYIQDNINYIKNLKLSYFAFQIEDNSDHFVKIIEKEFKTENIKII